MKRWPTKTLGEVAEVFNGKTPAKTEQRTSGHPVLKIRDVDEDGNFRGHNESFVDPAFAELNAKKKVCVSDVLILNAAHNADYVASKIFFAGDEVRDTIATGEWTIIRASPTSLNPGFIHNWVRSQIGRTSIKNLVRGIHLYPSDVASVQIPVPPLAEQERIVKLLDEADELRKLRVQADRRTAALLPALFHEMFGDPVANPKGWQKHPVSSFVAEFQGGTYLNPPGPNEATSIFRVLKISAVTWGKFRPNESKPIPATYEPPATHIVRAGDLLFSRANTTELVGATSYVFETPPNLLLPDKLWRFTWKEPRTVEPLYVWWLFQAASMRRELGVRATGTGGSMKNISKPKVMTLEVPVPPLPLQQEFAQRVTEIRALETGQAASRRRLENLFQSMLHRAFNGEL